MSLTINTTINANSSNTVSATSTAWAKALVLAEHQRKSSLSSPQDEAVEVVELSEEQCAEQAALLLTAVQKALPLTKAAAYVTTGPKHRRVLQVSRTRPFHGGRRWCVVQMDAHTLDYSIVWYFTRPNSDVVYRDGVGVTGAAVPVDGALAPKATAPGAFGYEVSAMLMNSEPMRLRF